MNKKVLIICVNYNSYGELGQFLDSVEKSAENAVGTHVEVIIADNSTIYEDVDVTSFQMITVTQQKYDNLGYLGGAQAVINNVKDILQYKYVIVSNVDLEFKRDTLSKLQAYNICDDIAWIAPDIYSEKFQKGLNPNVLSRYKSWKLKTLKLSYNKFLYFLYERLYYAKKNKASISQPFSEMDIYAGHGSCIILTANFFKCYQQINYPVFLYGEELYFAELILKKGMRVRYVPKIKLCTVGGVSTSKMPTKNFFRYNIEAINYILKTFY